MAHFGKATQQFRQPLDTAKQYRVSAWLGFKTAWNDDTRKFERQSPEEISICRKLFEELARHPGLQLSVNIDERLRDVDDVKQFPRVATMTLYVGNPPTHGYQQPQPVENPEHFDEIPFDNDKDADDVFVGFE